MSILIPVALYHKMLHISNIFYAKGCHVSSMLPHIFIQHKKSNLTNWIVETIQLKHCGKKLQLNQVEGNALQDWKMIFRRIIFACSA